MSEVRKSSLRIAPPSPRASLDSSILIYKCIQCEKQVKKEKMLPGLKYCSTACMLKYDELNNVRKYETRVAEHKFGSQRRAQKKLTDKKCQNCSNMVPKSRKESLFCSKRCKKKDTNKNKKRLTKIDLWSEENKRRWMQLRYFVFKKYGRKCMVCGATEKLHVDHIKPKSKHPELCWDIDNLQILCEPCNIGKGYEHEDDWRPSK